MCVVAINEKQKAMKSSMHKAAKLLNVLNTGYFHVKQSSRRGKRRTLAHTHTLIRVVRLRERF